MRTLATHELHWIGGGQAAPLPEGSVPSPPTKIDIGACPRDIFKAPQEAFQVTFVDEKQTSTDAALAYSSADVAFGAISVPKK